MPSLRKLLLVLLNSTCDTGRLICSSYGEALVHLSGRVTDHAVLKVCDLCLLPTGAFLDDFNLLFLWIQLAVLNVNHLILVLKQPRRQHQALQLARA